MKLEHIVAGAEIVLGVLIGAYLVIGLALSDRPVPLWLVVACAVAFWLVFWELSRKVRALVGREEAEE